MKKPSPNSGTGRRQFLREGLRLAVLGGVAAVTGRLVGQQAGRPAGQVCINAGICRGCAAFDDCELPNALSAKQVLGHSSGSHA